MQIQRSWLSALLLSLSAHLVLIAVFGNEWPFQGAAFAVNQKAQTPVSVRILKTLESPVKPVEPDATYSTSVEKVVMSTESERNGNDIPATEFATAIDLPAPGERMPIEDQPIPPKLVLTEPRYLGPDELTVKPHVVSDTASNQVLALPDIFPQPTIVQLLINEHGNIDKVVMEEAFLSETARHFVIDAFAKTIFSPGMLGEMPVKSRLMIEVRLDRALAVH